MRLLVSIAVFALFTSVSAQESKPLKIGFLTDLNGPHTDNDGKSAIEAARMAIAEFGGKILGRPIELVVGDHQNKPDVGLAVARRWYDSEGVDESSYGREEEDFSSDGRILVRLDRKGVYIKSRAMASRHPCVGL